MTDNKVPLDANDSVWLWVCDISVNFAILKQTEKQQKMTLVVGSVVLIVSSVVDYACIWLAGNQCYEKLFPFNSNCK